MRIADRLANRWNVRRYWEGEASGAAVVMPWYGPDPGRETATAAGLVEQATAAYRTNGVVFACMFARQMLLSEAVFKFRSKSTKRLYGSEDLRILEYPWPNGTTGDLWARMEQDDSLAGNAFWWKAEDDRLVRLPPKEVVIVSQEETNANGDRYRSVIGYDWDPAHAVPGISDQRTAQFFPVDEVAHWAPNPDPDANWRGAAWISPTLREVQADSGMVQYKTAYLDHGSPVTAVRYPMKLRQDTVDAVTERILAKYGGVGNAFKPLIFDQGADATLGKGLGELDYAAIQQIGEERICSAAGVPPAIIGLKSVDSSASYQTEMRRFADLTIRPLWRSGCAALQKLIPDQGRGVQLWFDTSDVAALQAAETERAQVTQVNAAALLTLTQSGFTRESSVAYVASGDVSQLVPDPNAPIPGTAARLTETTQASGSIHDPGITAARPQKLGAAPGGGQVLTTPQTAASKKPMPDTFPRRPGTNGRQPNLS